MEDGLSIDINSWTQPIINRLKQSDCRRRGWILEGFPRTRLQAVELQRVGFQPDYLIVLDGPDSVLKARDHGKKLDPQTGEFYHPLFNWTDDEEVLARLETPQRQESMEDETELFRSHKQALIQIHKNVSKLKHAWSLIFISELSRDQCRSAPVRYTSKSHLLHWPAKSIKRQANGARGHHGTARIGQGNTGDAPGIQVQLYGDQCQTACAA